MLINTVFFFVLNFVSFLTVTCMCVFQLLLMSLVNIIININKIPKKIQKKKQNILTGLATGNYCSIAVI